MNSTSSAPSPECAALSPLLPLISPPLLDAQQAARVEAHVAGCARCRAELAGYERTDQVLQRYAAPAMGRPPFTAEAIMRTVTAQAGGPHHGRVAGRAVQRWSFRRGLAATPALAAVLAVALVALSLFGMPGLPRFIQFGASHPPLPKDIEITGIAMASATEGWAVGNLPNDTAPPTPALLRYFAGDWRQVALPPGLDARAELTTIAMDSSVDGWAVATIPTRGDSYANSIGRSALLHFTAGRWAVSRAAVPGELTNLFLRGPSDAWASGRSDDGSGLLLHYDGQAWTRVRSPTFAGVSLGAVDALSVTDVRVLGMRVGAAGRDASFILHYDGRSWTQEPITIPNAALMAIVMVSPTDGWAVGAYCGCGVGFQQHMPRQGAYAALVLHYEHGVWQEITSPSRPLASPLFDLKMASASEGWAVGEDNRLLHLMHGTLAEVSSPTHHGGPNPSLVTLSLSSPTEGWAGGNQGTLLHLHDGEWTTYG
jgi:hypothetical protein